MTVTERLIRAGVIAITAYYDQWWAVTAFMSDDTLCHAEADSTDIVEALDRLLLEVEKQNKPKDGRIKA